MYPFRHRYGLEYVELKYMNVYRPCQDYHRAYIAGNIKILDAIDRAYESPTIMEYGSEPIDYVAVEVCTKANECGMSSKATDKFCNVRAGRRTSLKKLAEKLLNLTDSEKEIEYALESQATLVKNRIGCPVNEKKEIGFMADINLDEGLNSSIKWRASVKNEVEARKRSLGVS